MQNEDELQEPEIELKLADLPEEKDIPVPAVPPPRAVKLNISVKIPAEKKPVPVKTAPEPVPVPPPEIKLADPVPERPAVKFSAEVKKKTFGDFWRFGWIDRVLCRLKRIIGFCIFGIVFISLIFLCDLIWISFARPKNFAKIKSCVKEIFSVEPAHPRLTLCRFIFLEVKNSVAAAEKEEEKEIEEQRKKEDAERQKEWTDMQNEIKQGVLEYSLPEPEPQKGKNERSAQDTDW